MSQDENSVILMEFLEKGECRLLIIYSSPQGLLTPITTYPSTTKAKVIQAVSQLYTSGPIVMTIHCAQAVYFAKRHAEPIKKDTFHNQVMFGDLCSLPLEHLTSLVETVSLT